MKLALTPAVYLFVTVAGLWIAKHKGTPEFEEIRRSGQTTEVFRNLVKQTVWRPRARWIWPPDATPRPSPT